MHEAPPATVEEAVERSRRIHATEITYGDDVQNGVATLAPDAGPPNKIYEYLEHLAELTKARRSGPLGNTYVKWLEEFGVKATSESDTIKNDKDEMRKRTWDDGRGRRPFELHLKPSDATSPDRCVRIYFSWDEASAKIVVGWVGRHP